jgi:hypothetical protein
LGLAVVDRVLGGGAPAPVRLARRLHPAGALAAVASIVVSPGGPAGALAAGWLAVCLCATAGGAGLVVRLARAAAPVTAPSPGAPSSPPSDLPWRGPVPPTALAPARLPATVPPAGTLATLVMAAGLAFLSVGGGWLVASGLGARPFDLSSDIVRLTAVHFHYAGFGLAVLAATGLAAADWLASRTALVTGCLASVAGPPVVAAGFAYDSGEAQVVGAVIMTVAAWTVGFGTMLLATTRPRRGHGVPGSAGRTLLLVSAFSPIVPMLLAVQWALAQRTSLPALGIDDMAATHGLLNGVGFVMAGLGGWLLVGVTAGAPGAAGRAWLAAPEP